MIRSDSGSGGTYSEFDESNSADMSDDSYLLNNLQKGKDIKYINDVNILGILYSYSTDN